MDIKIIVGYCVLLLIQYLSISTLPIGIVGALLHRLFKFGPKLGLLVAGILIWQLINLLWMVLFDNPLPFLAFAISILWQVFHFIIKKKELNNNAKLLIIGETWSIVLVAVYVLVFLEFNWF